MTIIDIILLVVIGAGAVIGFIKGFIRQLASILGLIVGLLAAKALYVSVAERVFSRITDSMTFAQILAFVVIWVVVPLLFFTGGIFVDEGDGSNFSRLAEPLAGCRIGGIEIPATGEPAYLCCRVYRLG